jgi:hypothetical protein
MERIRNHRGRNAATRRQKKYCTCVSLPIGKTAEASRF